MQQTLVGNRITPDIVDSVFVQPEAALLIRAVDELLDVLPDVVGKLFEEDFRLVVR